MSEELLAEFSLNGMQFAQFEQYYQLLVEKNKVMNLTAITAKHEVYSKHFYDSLTVSKVIDFQNVNTVIDVGTGAGFPGIPLKILFPHLQLTLLDSLLKRVHFLQEVGETLGFDHVTYVHGRAEELGQLADYRQQYDLGVSRAVAKLNVLTEYGVPFIRVGGQFVAMKGAAIDEELATANRALATLGKIEVTTYPLSLPENMGQRHLVVLKKQQPTPKKYPRKAALMKKNPL
jgi:16S rRNA (guanine527-N7)-methyltransferase